MASSKSAYDAFSAVDKLVAKPVLGSDGAASWQEFRKETKELQRESVAPSLQVKRADRLGTGLMTLAEERSNEKKIRSEAGDASLGSGYTSFKRKNDAEEAAERKRRKLIEKRIRPDKKPYFLASEIFTGWKFDYVFTTRDRGTGYYWDGIDSLKKLQGIEEFPGDLPVQLNAADQMKETATETAAVAAKKRKVEKKLPVVIWHDPQNPLEQVANAIRRRNDALKAPPFGISTLPIGWENASDPATGKIYYFNRSTGQQQWDPPNSVLPTGWKSASDLTSGKIYYYHTNGEITWVKPME